MVMISHLVKANKKSFSFKTTIPRQVIETLQIVSTDVLQWKVAEEKGEAYAKVKKVKG
jgi:hypothetical protein